MTFVKPQAQSKKVEVKAPGSAMPTVVEPGVTYSFNIVLDKAGSTAIAQFHLPLSMQEEEMQSYTQKALRVVELVQLKFDRDKLKVEIKLSSVMIDRQKEELQQARKARDEEAKRSGNGKVAKPVNQQLIALDNSLRQSMSRHDAMLLDLAQMEKKLGTVSSDFN
jgi:hypothetical protein